MRLRSIAVKRKRARALTAGENVPLVTFARACDYCCSYVGMNASGRSSVYARSKMSVRA